MESTRTRNVHSLEAPPVHDALILLLILALMLLLVVPLGAFLEWLLG
jgi:hypothetical protein